jgi:hypothetical protein
MESSQIDENLLKWMKMVKLDEILVMSFLPKFRILEKKTAIWQYFASKTNVAHHCLQPLPSLSSSLCPLESPLLLRFPLLPFASLSVPSSTSASTFLLRYRHLKETLAIYWLTKMVVQKIY